ncbi:MAG TPA: serine protease, partial [Dehalococcoidia bacterium]|nr:serine protease [Dehalococcoidia bacterium]
MVFSAVLLAACSGSASPSATPLAGDKLSGRTNATQPESCAPLSSPAALVARSLVHITTPPDTSGQYSSGTGIIIDQDWVLTNEHVIDGAQNETLRLYFFDNDQSGRYDVLAPGRVVAADPDLDLALVQTDTDGLPTVIWGDEGKLQNGSPLIAVGFPLGLPTPALSSGRFLETQVDRAT